MHSLSTTMACWHSSSECRHMHFCNNPAPSTAESTPLKPHLIHICFFQWEKASRTTERATSGPFDPDGQGGLLLFTFYWPLPQSRNNLCLYFNLKTTTKPCFVLFFSLINSGLLVKTRLNGCRKTPFKHNAPWWNHKKIIYYIVKETTDRSIKGNKQFK